MFETRTNLQSLVQNSSFLALSVQNPRGENILWPGEAAENFAYCLAISIRLDCDVRFRVQSLKARLC